VYVLERSQFDLVAAQFPGILEPIRKNMADVRLKRIGPTPRHRGGGSILAPENTRSQRFRPSRSAGARSSPAGSFHLG